MDTTETKLDGIKNKLALAVGKLQTSEDWKAMLRNVARANKLGAGRLSFRNQLLVMCQLGCVQQVATYKSWQKIDRQVRKGEKAAWILAPVIVKDKKTGSDERKLVGFKGMAVFAAEQTDGAPIPEGPKLCSPVDSDEAFAGSVEKLTAVALSLGCVSSVTVRPREAGDPNGAAGWYVRSSKAIVVIDDGNRAAMFAVLVHEIAHAILHGEDDHHSRPEKEVEAESTAFTVCEALGMDTSGFSLPYVAGWAGNENGEAMVLASGERIVRAARRILEALGAEQAADESEAA